MERHENQIFPKGAYMMNPDNKTSLWNMIQKYKLDKEDDKDKQINQKTYNSAV